MRNRLALVLFVLATSTGVALAQPAQTQPSAGAVAIKPRPPAEPPAPTEAAAEIKAAKGVEKREPVEEGTTFASGDTVYAWTRVTGAAGTKVTHVWKKDGKEVWKAYLKIGSKRWTTQSRRKVKPGAWTVDVVTADGTVLGSVAFTVQ